MEGDPDSHTALQMALEDASVSQHALNPRKSGLTNYIVDITEGDVSQ
jgi:hypothetical protein